jgi:signal transduction histidine kinase/ActR/RegA family two-component response regulator
LHPYLICLLACATVAAYAWLVVNKSVRLRDANLVAAQWHDLVSTNERMLGALRDAETGQRGYLLTMQAGYLDPYEAAVQTVPELAIRLDNLTHDIPEQQRKAREMLDLAQQKLAELAATISLARGGDSKGAVALVNTNRGKALMDQIRDLASDIDTGAGLRAAAYRATAEQQAGQMIASVILMSGLSIALLICLTYILRRDARLIRESEEQLSITLRSIGDAVVTTDARGNVTFLNPVAVDLVRGTELTAPTPFKEVLRLVNEVTGADAEDPIARVLSEGKTIGLANHTALVRRDGTSISIEDSAAPLLDDHGHVRGVVFVFKDISERRRAELALADAQHQLHANLASLKATEEELRAVDRQKDAFLATLAHELRNPVAPIRHAVKLLDNEGLGREQVQWARGVIARQIEHMARLLDDLLDSARITRGELALQLAHVELGSIVSDALDVAKPLIERKGHTLQVNLPERPVTLMVDGIRIAQVLSNLLTNAAKYTDTAGRIVLEAALDAEQLLISVKDSGVGIRPETRPRLFGMFSQIKSTTDRSEGGLGIGLALAKELVELHGGEIDVRSGGDNQGSEFIVRLPSSVVLEQAPLAPVEAARKDGPEARLVLIADDNVDAAASLGMLLELSGNEVLVTYNGADAIDAARLHHPSVVILDIGMPDLDGYQVAETLRREARGGEYLLIALTGWGQAEDRQRALQAGFDFHFTKPVDLQAIETAIAKHARRQ